ncbi:hypothetical protein LEP1GSC052_1054 [Leptospira kmetyi serovar Malaysia str. Bejo-Iso9]|nr:hypothetical protein LEP1GSC052_1054 [Leptospira kmetyi serovar Malaysia str. Bejo-Iso9]
MNCLRERQKRLGSSRNFFGFRMKIRIREQNRIYLPHGSHSM